MNIPEEAVDASFAVVVKRNEEDGFTLDYDENDWANIHRMLREDLEAAAPFIAAQVLRGYGAGLIDRMCEEQELSVREVNEDAREQADEMDPR